MKDNRKRACVAVVDGVCREWGGAERGQGRGGWRMGWGARCLSSPGAEVLL